MHQQLHEGPFKTALPTGSFSTCSPSHSLSHANMGETECQPLIIKKWVYHTPFSATCKHPCS